MDKEYLEVSLHTVNDKVKFASSAEENPEIAIDYYPPFGDAQGYTSLELLLISLTSCLSTAMLTLLRARMSRTISALQANAKGILRQEHPKALTHIQIDMVFDSPDAQEEDLQKALAASEEKICPVWAMLKGNVEISVSYTIKR